MIAGKYYTWQFLKDRHCNKNQSWVWNPERPPLCPFTTRSSFSTCEIMVLFQSYHKAQLDWFSKVDMSRNLWMYGSPGIFSSITLINSFQLKCAKQKSNGNISIDLRILMRRLSSRMAQTWTKCRPNRDGLLVSEILPYISFYIW